MAINVYEGMLLLESSRHGHDPERVSGQIAEILQQAGGELLVSRLWEERRLAYPIKGHRKGVYWLTYFRVDGNKLAEINRKFQLSEGILRTLFVKVDPRIVDTLVEHAQAGPTKSVGRPGIGQSVKDKDKDKAAQPDEPAAVAESASGKK